MSYAKDVNSNMFSFEYPLFFKLLYRYGNVPVTIILSVYLIMALINLERNLLFIIPIIITLLLIYFLNRHYLLLYKIVPYKIKADSEKITCSNFLFDKKETVIYFNDIESFTGGALSGKLNGVMKICDSKNKVCIGFYDKLKDVNKLQTLVLSKVRKDVYDAVMEKVGLKGKK